MPLFMYNRLEVITMTEKEYAKALVDKLKKNQLQALITFLEAFVWPAEELTPDEASELEEARAEIEAGRGIKASDVWKELGI